MFTKSNLIKSLLACMWVAVSLVLMIYPALAEDFSPVSGHYVIDVPEGWSHRDNGNENTSMVYVVNPEGTNGMKIVVTPYSPAEDEEVEDYLARRTEHMVSKVQGREKGKVFDIEDVELDHVSARHIAFQMMTGTGLQQGSQTFLIYNGRQYMVTYGSADPKEKTEMDKILETFRFQSSSKEPPSSE